MGQPLTLKSMQNIKKPLLIGFASLVPGLGLVIARKRSWGMAAIFLFVIFAALLYFYPTEITWLLLGAEYLIQIALSVGLAMLHSVSGPGEKVDRDAGLPESLTEKSKQGKVFGEEIKQRLSQILSAEEKQELISSLLGVEQEKPGQYFLGVTQQDLVIAVCNSFGNPGNVQRIPKESISWVRLSFRATDELLSITFDDETKRTFEIPLSLREQSQIFRKEFPGIWQNDDDLVQARSFIPHFRLSDLIVSVVAALIILVALAILTGNLQTPFPKYQPLIGTILISVAFYFFSWLPFIRFISQFKQMGNIRGGNFIKGLYYFYPVPIFWFFALHFVSPSVVYIVKFLLKGS